MSEPLNATRAPESDAAELTEPSIISEHDSKAQTGASMGEHCTSDRPLTSGQVPSGELTKFDEIDVYVSKPADYPNTPGNLLLLLTGGTGVHSINNQLQADMYAKEGFLVVMPDQFSGDPAPNSKTMTEDTGSSWLEFIKLRTAETAKSFLLDMWLARHTPEKVMPIINKVLDTAKDEYADAVANGGGVYAAGYCFGAKYVIILAGEDPNKSIRIQPTNDEEQGAIPTKGPFIKAGAIAHATLVTRDDLADVKAPLSMACVENDPLFPDEILEFGKKTFASSNIQHEITMYKEVPHGFAVVGEYDSTTIEVKQGLAFKQMLSWLNNH